MRISFWSIGKPNETYIKEGVDDFTRRISRYFNVEWKIIPPPKHAASYTAANLKLKESELIAQSLSKGDYLVILDERGKQLQSAELAEFLQQRATESTKNIVFLIGGAYGIDKGLLGKANMKWSLSSLTFPHQLVRLILAEQIYRACSILHNEKYHHE